MLLQIDKLNAFLSNVQGDSSQILNDVSFKIPTGKTVALVGESGSGKSVTALSILRLYEENPIIKNSGSIVFNGLDLLTAPMNKIRNIRGNKISMIFQEPMTSLNPVYTVGNQLAESLKSHRQLNKETAKREAIKLFDQMGIPDAEKRFDFYPHQLSGGQRQRVMISMALACQPSLLIADEPTTALDVTIQAQILDLLKNVQNKNNMSILLITHDLNMVKSFADYICIMKNGSIVEKGPKEEIFTNNKHSYTRKLINSVFNNDPIKLTCKETIFKTKSLSCFFRNKTILKNFFTGKKSWFTAVNDISLEIKKGDTLGIIGESGSGKTTLGLAMLKLTDSKGDIVFNNLNIQKLGEKDLRPLRRNMQIVFQDPFSSLSPRFTIEQIVGEGLVAHNIGNNKAERQQMVIEALNEVGIEQEALYRFPHEFSGGQRQRIAIARAIILKPELIIFDEPTSALDMTVQKNIVELLHILQNKFNITYVFISHDLRVIKAVANNIIVMKDGKSIEAGTASDIFNSPTHPYTIKLLEATL